MLMSCGSRAFALQSEIIKNILENNTKNIYIYFYNIIVYMTLLKGSQLP